tara:strand:- start:263 stop:529 length:267 start_codon:yes stop_codon:yes gene_type:complete
MNSDLNGRLALVTGFVQGIGLEVANSFAEQGARIALHRLADVAKITEVTKVMKEAGASVVCFFEGDTPDPDAIQLMVGGRHSKIFSIL